MIYTYDQYNERVLNGAALPVVFKDQVCLK